MKIAHEAIAGLVPHAGAMCLLHGILEWDETRIVCCARSHLDSTNPLRRSGMLPALAGIEYAGQAMAAHGALCDKGARGRVGYLVSLRSVAVGVARLDDAGDELTVRATRLSPSGRELLYDFRLEVPGRELLSGRALVLLREQG